MEMLTVVFPIVIVAFILLVFSSYIFVLFRSKEPLLEGAKTKSMSRKDGIAVLVITAIYAITAFTGLGDTTAPETFCKFKAKGEYALIELDDTYELTSIMYYTGLYTGNYYFQVSEDGEEFEDIVTLEQKHSDLFKWFVVEFEETITAKYVRLISDQQIWMGELALFDEGGILPADYFSYGDGTRTLFDEQELVPEKPTYLNGMYFDEIYHGRTAFENVKNIYPYEVSHPPLGKLLISIGIRAFGMTPFGWRFIGTLFGVLMLPILYTLLKKMFGTFIISVCGTLIFAFDFMHFVQTRIATIDTYAVFFILLMYLFMYIYLNSSRRRMRSYLVPLALCGVSFGLGVACKWTCFYAGAGLAVMWLYDRIYRGVRLCRAGRRQMFVRETIIIVLWSILFFVVVPFVIYYLSYIPYGEAKGYGVFSREYFNIVKDNQTFMFSYHQGVHSEHPYSSRFYEWILDLRPILYYLRYYDESGTYASFGAFVNPLLCWGGLLAMLFMIYLAIFRRDKKAAFIVVGYLAQLAPWFFITRTTFAYHYFPSTVFLVLALAHVFSTIRCNLTHWKWPIISFTVVSLVLFIVFYPVLTGITIPRWYGDAFLEWLPRWPF